MSDIRKDPFSNTWVIIAAERAARPHVEEKEAEQDVEHCPFCENPEITAPIPPYATCAGEEDKDGNWITKIIPNKYPALTPDPQLEQEQIDGIYHNLTGVGGHDILIETPEHKYFSWSTMPVEQIQAALRNYRCRYSFWQNDPRIEYLSIFRNYGHVAGASLKHPHSQMVATPLVPPRIEQELEEMKRHYEQSNHCLMCHIIELELKSKTRLIMENGDFAAFTNFAPRFPYETLIAPKKHMDAFEEITDEQITNLAALLSELFKKFDKLLNDPPYNLILHVSPLRTSGLLYYHWHIEIIMRLSQPAGFEWGSGVYINSVAPEEAAKELIKTAT